MLRTAGVQTGEGEPGAVRCAINVRTSIAAGKRPVSNISESFVERTPD